MASARFLLRPRWLLSHLLVVALAVTMVNLGFWQLRRLDERRDRNELIESQMEQPAVAVEELLDPADGAADVDQARARSRPAIGSGTVEDRLDPADAAVDRARFRAVTATGSYQPDETVQVRNRTQDGVAGAWLVTPIELAGGERAGVIRGFVGFAPDGSIQNPPPPSGETTVTGVVVDPNRLDGTASGEVEPLVDEDDVLPGLVMATESDPPEPAASDPTAGASVAGVAGGDAASIVPVAPPELGEGPHLSYAVQWFIFSTIGVVGYPLILRRVVIRRGKEVDDAGDDIEAGAPPVDDLDRELEELLRQGR